MPDNYAMRALRHHVTGAVERGEAEPITEVTDDSLIREGIHGLPVSDDPNDYPPDYADDPSFYESD